MKKYSIFSKKKRYELLFSKCKKLNISNLILTGHHLDDLFENFFIRMIRGSGLKGLVSLDKVSKFSSINLLRPLLYFEKRFNIYSDHVFNFYVNDPTNENILYQRIKIKKYY